MRDDFVQVNFANAVRFSRCLRLVHRIEHVGPTAAQAGKLSAVDVVPVLDAHHVHVHVP